MSNLKLTFAASIIAGFVAICGVEYLAYRSNLLDAQAKLYHVSGQVIPQTVPQREGSWYATLPSPPAVPAPTIIDWGPVVGQDATGVFPAWVATVDGSIIGQVQFRFKPKPGTMYRAFCEDARDYVVAMDTLKDAQLYVEHRCIREPQ